MRSFRVAVLSFGMALGCMAIAEEKKKVEEKPAPGSRASEPMAEVSKVAPKIRIELRYATNQNLAKYPVYPKNARCFLRESVIARLLKAQEWLDTNDTRARLKIWDGWRPPAAHERLWQVVPNREYLGDPRRGGSLHSWGVAVDATLVGRDGLDLKMPTDFDQLGTKARTRYEGNNPEISRNLRWLQQAMTYGGFMVVVDEWWHFVARDWEAFAEVEWSLTDPPQVAADTVSAGKATLKKLQK